MTPLIELFSSGGPVVMCCIAAVSLAAWYLTFCTWTAAGHLLKRVDQISVPLLRPLSHRGDEWFSRVLPDWRESYGEYQSLCLGMEAQTMRLKRRLWLIGMLAEMLPLLGLLGTVFGMLISFEVIQIHGTSQPRLLAGGICQALITTQAGLWTAVPVLFSHHIIRSRVRLIGSQMEVLSHVLQSSSANGRLEQPGQNHAKPPSNKRQANHCGDR